MIDHWFWKYAFENKGSYFQAGVATFFVNIFALAVGFFVMVVYDRIIPNNAITSLTGLFFWSISCYPTEVFFRIAEDILPRLCGTNY